MQQVNLKNWQRPVYALPGIILPLLILRALRISPFFIGEKMPYELMPLESRLNLLISTVGIVALLLITALIVPFYVADRNHNRRELLTLFLYELFFLCIIAGILIFINKSTEYSNFNI